MVPNTRVVVTRYGGPEVLEVVRERLEPPAPGEVRVKVESAGVALADVMRREGKYPLSPAPPFTPGYDAVGIVEELGEGVEAVAAGDRVAVFSVTGTGGYAAYANVKAEELVPVPASVDAAEAVAVILNYISAHQLLHRIAKVKEGERVLIHGASGGMGTALLELGRLAGLRMYGTASASKHDIVAAFGAVPIDYRSEDFVEVLRQEAPGGVDAVFDGIGGLNWQRSMQTLGRSGRFVGYGYTSVLDQGKPEDWANDWKRLAASGATEQGHPAYTYSITGLRQEVPEWFREDAEKLFSLLAAGRLRPVISERIPLEEAARAHRLLESSASTGKIVLMT